jgi:hypothetical protein
MHGGEKIAQKEACSRPCRRAQPEWWAAGAVAMARYSMYGLLVISQTLNWFTRVGMPQLIPFIVTDMALSEAQRALLMGAFFPPCAASHTPPPPPPLCLKMRIAGPAEFAPSSSCGKAAFAF